MSKKMLLISNLYPNKNFPEYGTFVHDFVTGLTKFDWKITKVVLDKKRGRIYKILSYIFFLFKSWIFLNKNDHDITYIHYASHSSIPLVVSKKQKYLVVNVHGSDVLPNKKKQKIFSIFTRYAIHKANLVVVPSAYFKEIILKKYSIPSEKVFISPSGGIDESFFKSNRPLSDGHLKFGYVGRIEPGKGWRIFLQAIQKANIKNANYIMVGTGSEENELKKEIEKLSNYNIVYMGQQGHESLIDIYSSFDWLVFPSKQESLGLVGLESMAVGTPIIASDISGIKTYAIDKKNALLFQSGNSDMLASHMSMVDKMTLEEWNNYSNTGINTANGYRKMNVMWAMDQKLLTALPNK